MDSMLAFGMARAASGNEHMVFDWDKAARMIVDHKATDAEAGLQSDWDYTGDFILLDGKAVHRDNSQCYLSSNWATPQIQINGIVYDCYIMQSYTKWGALTFWPESALKILEEGKLK